MFWVFWWTVSKYYFWVFRYFDIMMFLIFFLNFFIDKVLLIVCGLTWCVLREDLCFIFSATMSEFSIKLINLQEFYLDFLLTDVKLMLLRINFLQNWPPIVFLLFKFETGLFIWVFNCKRIICFMQLLLFSFDFFQSQTLLYHWGKEIVYDMIFCRPPEFVHTKNTTEDPPLISGDLR